MERVNLADKLAQGISTELEGFVIVPHDFEHMPVSDAEVSSLRCEPKNSRNTGNPQDERTRTEMGRL